MGRLGPPLLILISTGCSSGFEAASVYPRMAYDDEGGQLYIYGHGFEPGSTANVSWKDPVSGDPVNVAITDLELLDAYTLRGTLPVLEDLPYPIFPYHEFTDAPEEITPGLFDCATLKPLIWDEVTTEGYCDAAGVKLSYVGPDPDERLIPPGAFDGSSLAYATWYDLLYYCSFNYDPSSSSLTDEQLRRLIPDYRLGCFYPDDPERNIGGTDDAGRPLEYSYCPAQIPAIEVDIIVNLPDSSQSVISRALTLLDWTHDYEFNPDFATGIWGRYGVYRRVPVGAGPVAAAFGDLTNDGYPDLVTADAGDETVSLVSGPYFFVDDPGLTYVETIGVGSGPVDLVVADFNGDDLQDIATANAGSKNVTLRFGLEETDEEGITSVTHQEGLSLALTVGSTPAVPSGLEAVDLSGDGRLDLVVPVPALDALLVYLQDGDGGFGAASTLVVDGGPTRVAPGDVDNDGDVDLVTSNVVDGTLGVLLNNGSGGFPGLKVVALGVTPGRPATAHGYAEDEIQEVETLVDLNGDLLADVVVIDADAGRILYLLSMGDGTFDDAIEVDTTGAWPVALSLGEANNDGFPDLLVAYADGSGASFFNKGESGVGFFEVDGLDAGQTPVDMIAPDRDFDGDNDLAVVDADGYVSILLNPSTLFEYYRYTLNRCRI